MSFFEALKNLEKKFVATKLEGGGVKALLAGPLKKYRYFFAASLRETGKNRASTGYCTGSSFKYPRRMPDPVGSS